MRALTYERCGPLKDVLKLGENIEFAPKAGKGRVSLAGSNPSDIKRRTSARARIVAAPFKKACLHSDGAGIIEAVGEGVDQ